MEAFAGGGEACERSGRAGRPQDTSRSRCWYNELKKRSGWEDAALMFGLFLQKEARGLFSLSVSLLPSTCHRADHW